MGKEELEQFQLYSAWFLVSLTYIGTNRDNNQPCLVGKQGLSGTFISQVQAKPADAVCHGKGLLSILQSVTVSDCIGTPQ